jgi:hypothetical protein
LETTGTRDYGVCCTCGKQFHFNELQAGHFVDGRNNAVLFVEDIVHIQCVSCNCFMSGNKDSYTLYMLDRYGKEKVEMMLLLKNINKSLSQFELEAIYQDICEKIKKISEV